MKKYILAIFLFYFFLLPSCGDSFLEVVPEDDISLSEFLDSPAKAQELLNGGYRVLADQNFMGALAWFLSDLMADNINGSTNALNNGDWRAHYTWTTDIFLGTTRGIMAMGGQAKGRANYLIQYIDLVPGLSDADKKRMLAEAHFLRAIGHYELVRLFAQPYGFSADNSHQGISIFTEYTTSGKPQSTVKEVYDQVVADFQYAIDNLPATNGVYATSWSAKGYLAKVYFQMHEYQKAYDLANDVLSNGGFGWDTDFAARFSETGSAESVFSLVSGVYKDAGGNDVTVNLAGELQGIYRLNPDNTARAYISDDAFAAASAQQGDLRVGAWFEQLNSGLIVLNKFAPTAKFVQIPLVHITELKLIRAEAAAETGNNLVQAAQDVNDVKDRAGVPPISANAADVTIIAAARAERRIELVGEGNRLQELKRIGAASERGVTKLPEQVKVRGTAPWNCNGMVCQYPERELVGFPGLKPNPTGGCN
jgi:hypothetical protein